MQSNINENDFEVCPIGTNQELKLYRDLFYNIQRDINQWGPGIVTIDIKNSYNKLCKHYEKYNVILDRTV
jgi:hypothetical protein